jgi:hypothetical protein
MVMRHFLATAAAAALLAGPAMAVDYVKCEAMNSVNTRLQFQLNQELKEAALASIAFREVQKCGPKPSWSEPSFAIWSSCSSVVGAYPTDADKQLTEAPIYAKYEKKLTALKKDHNKEGCP